MLTANKLEVDPGEVAKNFDFYSREYYGRSLDPVSARRAIANEFQASNTYSWIGMLANKYAVKNDPAIFEEMLSLRDSLPAPDEKRRDVPKWRLEHMIRDSFFPVCSLLVLPVMGNGDAKDRPSRIMPPRAPAERTDCAIRGLVCGVCGLRGVGCVRGGCHFWEEHLGARSVRRDAVRATKIHIRTD